MVEAALPCSSTAFRHGVTEADGCAAPTVSGEEVVGAECAEARVVVHVPLDAEIVDGFEAKARDDGRKVPRLREEGDSAQVERGVKDVAAIRNDCAAEFGVDENLLRNPPACPFPRVFLHRPASASA